MLGQISVRESFVDVLQCLALRDFLYVNFFMPREFLLTSRYSARELFFLMNLMLTFYTVLR